jgi:hypothetical protein
MQVMAQHQVSSLQKDGSLDSQASLPATVPLLGSSHPLE